LDNARFGLLADLPTHISYIPNKQNSPVYADKPCLKNSYLFILVRL